MPRKIILSYFVMVIDFQRSCNCSGIEQFAVSFANGALKYQSFQVPKTMRLNAF